MQPRKLQLALTDGLRTWTGAVARASKLLREQGVACPMIYRSVRDDWIMSTVVASLGVALMPEGCLAYPGVAARPPIEPEFWREVDLVDRL